VVVLFTCGVIGRTAEQGVKSTHIDDATIVYEEYQEIYNTCQKLNTDLGIIQTTPDNDKQFDQFSKAQRLNAIKQNLNRWVEDYNAKSKMWGRSLWKSKQLPYQLSVNDFSNYK
jgi:hypothetical protein